MPRRRTRTPSWPVPLLALALGLGVLTGCDDEPARPGARPAASTSASPSATPRTPAQRLGLVTGWGPTGSELERAARAAGRLSVPELAGQVIVASYAGTRPPVGLVRRLHLGGVIVFSDNVVSTAQVRASNRTLQRAARRPWPLLVSVDQEGGTVERVKDDATRFPAFMAAGAADDATLTGSAYAALGRELRGLGFNVDFAPDADVTSGATDPTIGSRSAGDRPDRVTSQVRAAADGFLRAGVLPVLKHFPGHGSVPADSHLTLPVQTRSLRRLRAVDLVPFAAAVHDGLPAIMVGHIDVRAVAPRIPSSLSRKVVTGLLREDLGFQGAVFTDALDMRGVAARFPSGRSAVRALDAGADVLLMPPDPAAARAAVVHAVRSGALPRRRLRQAAARMIALLLHQASLGTEAAAPGSARGAAARLSAAAVTSVAGPCRGALVGGAVTPYGDAAAVASFADAARAAGLSVLLRRSPPAGLTAAEPRPQPPVIEPAKKPAKRRQQAKERKAYRRQLRAWRAREERRRRRLAAWQRAEDARLATGTSVGLAGPGSGALRASVVVATDTPYVLARSTGTAKLATFGSGPGAMTALVDVLLGRTAAPGRLPVRVAGLRRGC